jgi:hypothetical protein
LIRLLREMPVLWEAWEGIVRSVAAAPGGYVADLATARSLGLEPPDWRAHIPEIIERAVARAYSHDRGRVLRVALGDAMDGLRGKVPAAEVSNELRRALEGKERIPCRTE